MSFADKTLTCRDCGMGFVFTAGEQEFYEQKGFTNEPTRCPSCRQARKQQRNSGDSFGSRDRNSYGSNDRYSSYGSSDRYSSYGSSDRYSSGGFGGGYSGGGQREMHTTTCSSCGKPAQVPFVPRGDKPVYCSDCFQSQRPARRESRW